MKKAKSILSLMLVVTMLLGMMVFTTGTATAAKLSDYADLDSIEYVEAVDVLTALGVLTGRDDGNFDPQAIITRAEAAKIISYLLLGTTAADRLTTQTSSFTDTVGHWANPWIEYCAARGIILGMGNGKYEPDSPVTASQFAKMLLFAIGYGQRGEYTGERWEINTIVDAQRVDILTLDEDFTQPATREQIAQYSFNALSEDKAYLVTYNTLIDGYITADSTNPFAQVPGSKLINKTFGVYESNGIDPMGYTTRVWRLGSAINAAKLTNAYRADKTLGSSSFGFSLVDTSGMKYGLTDIGGMFYMATIKPYYDESASVAQLVNMEVYLNGVLVAADTDVSALINAVVNPTAAVADQVTVNGLSGIRGVTVELIDRNNDGYADKLVFTQKRASVITSAPAINSAGTVTIGGVYSAATSSNTFGSSAVKYPADLKAGDVVLYYTDNDPTGRVTHIELAKSVSGVFQSFTPYYMGATPYPSYDSINLGGTSYYPSGLVATLTDQYDTFYDYARTSGYFNYGAIAYLDDAGAIVAITPEEEADLDYLVVLQVNTGMFSTQAAVVLTDASYRVITIASLHDGTNTLVNGTDISNHLLNGVTPTSVYKIYAYSVNADGSYALRAVSNKVITNKGVTQNANFTTADDGVLIGDSSTVFIVEVPGSVTYYSRYIGVSNAPVYKDGNTTSGKAVVSSADITKFVFFTGAPSTIQTSTLMFGSISSFTEIRDGSNMRYIYNVVDTDSTEGATTKAVTLSSDAHLAVQAYGAATGYTSMLASVGYNADGLVVEASFPAAADLLSRAMFIDFNIKNNASNGIVNFANKSYRYDANTKVFIRTLDTVITRATIGDVAIDPNALVFGRLAANSAGTTDLITELYIIRRSAPAVSPSQGLAEHDLGTVSAATTTWEAISALIPSSFQVLFDNGAYDTIANANAYWYLGSLQGMPLNMDMTTFAPLPMTGAVTTPGTYICGIFLQGAMTPFATYTIVVTA